MPKSCSKTIVLPSPEMTREADVAAGELGHLLGLAAALGDAPDVGLALALAVGDEVDEAVLAPQRPGVHAVEARSGP